MELVPYKSNILPKEAEAAPEKRALATLSSVGLGCANGREDSLEFAGINWSLSAQLANHIQCCGRILVRRSENGKHTSIRGTPRSLLVESPNKLPDSNMVTQNGRARISKEIP